MPITTIISISVKADRNRFVVKWSMVDGRWSMVDGRWSMVDGHKIIVPFLQENTRIIALLG
ncbi:MAG: hypothetical protein ACSW8C_01225 [bacterium]